MVVLCSVHDHIVALEGFNNVDKLFLVFNKALLCPGAERFAFGPLQECSPHFFNRTFVLVVLDTGQYFEDNLLLCSINAALGLVEQLIHLLFVVNLHPLGEGLVYVGLVLLSVCCSSGLVSLRSGVERNVLLFGLDLHFFVLFHLLVGLDLWFDLLLEDGHPEESDSDVDVLDVDRLGLSELCVGRCETEHSFEGTHGDGY